MGSNGNITKVSNGHLTETAQKEYTSYAKTMQSNAAHKVNEHSGDGVEFGEPEVKTLKDDTIDITIGVFFDGTCNNKMNNQLRVAHNKATNNAPWKFNTEDSFENAPSNVQNLETVYPQEDFYFSVYIEGVGTENKKADNSYGYSLGYGDTGILEKVKWGCERVAEQVKAAIDNQDKKVNRLTIDIFGFSRGATCARNFVHEINKPAEPVALYPAADKTKDYYISPLDNKPRYIQKESYVKAHGAQTMVHTPPMGNLGQYLKDKQAEYKILYLRFGGLFDSVSAYGVMHRNDVRELDLHAIDRVAHVVHLTAADEHRDNFESTAINKGISKSLPGVHSDIGGGYRDLFEDKTVLEVNKKEDIVISVDEHVNEDYKRLIDQSWYSEEQLTKKLNGDTMLLIGKRTLSNKYSYIPLHLMAEFCERFSKVTINKTRLNDAYTVASNDPKLNLKDVHQRLREYCFSTSMPMTYFTDSELSSLSLRAQKGELSGKNFSAFKKDQNMLKELRNRYLHYSAKESFGLYPAFNNVRKIYK